MHNYRFLSTGKCSSISRFNQDCMILLLNTFVKPNNDYVVEVVAN